MDEDDIEAGLFGDIDYSRLTAAAAFVKSGRPIAKQVQIGPTQTLQQEYDIGQSKASILSVRTVAVSGTTDTTVSIHESESYDKTDQVYKAKKVSASDANPTGGPVGKGDGIQYVDLTESDTLHVQFEEKSGTSGALALRINYI